MSRIFGQYFLAALFDKDGEFERTVQQLDLRPAVEWYSENDEEQIEEPESEILNSSDLEK